MKVCLTDVRKVAIKEAYIKLVRKGLLQLDKLQE